MTPELLTQTQTGVRGGKMRIKVNNATCLMSCFMLLIMMLEYNVFVCKSLCFYDI